MPKEVVRSDQVQNFIDGLTTVKDQIRLQLIGDEKAHVERIKERRRDITAFVREINQDKDFLKALSNPAVTQYLDVLYRNQNEEIRGLKLHKKAHETGGPEMFAITSVGCIYLPNESEELFYNLRRTKNILRLSMLFKDDGFFASTSSEQMRETLNNRLAQILQQVNGSPIAGHSGVVDSGY